MVRKTSKYPKSFGRAVVITTPTRAHTPAQDVSIPPTVMTCFSFKPVTSPVPMVYLIILLIMESVRSNPDLRRRRRTTNVQARVVSTKAKTALIAVAVAM